jgi:hypothetical protein
MKGSGSLQIITDPDPGSPKTSGSGTRVADPIRIRIQSGSRGFNDQKLGGKNSLKKKTFFLIKNYNLSIPRPP